MGETRARVTDQQVFEPPRPSAQVGDTLEMPLGHSSVEIDYACFAGRCGGRWDADGFGQKETVLRNNGHYATIGVSVTAPGENNFRRVRYPRVSHTLATTSAAPKTMAPGDKRVSSRRNSYP